MHINSVLGIRSMEGSTIEKILSRTDSIISYPEHYSQILRGITIGCLFFEPSTRTQLSFESAIYKMGGNCLNYHDEYSSSKKGESLQDTIKTIENYCEGMIIRHPCKESVQNCAKYTNLPVINAGDGDGEHPSQALLDLYTIQKYLTSNSFTIGFCGDAKHSRTINSLILLLEKMKYNVRYVFITCSKLRPDIDKLDIDRNRYSFYNSMEEIIGEIDILYMTRIQKERHEEGMGDIYEIKLTQEILDISKDNMIVLHPLPRNNEISPELDNNKKCKYFEQVKNGVYVRMALLLYILENKNLMNTKPTK